MIYNRHILSVLRVSVLILYLTIPKLQFVHAQQKAAIDNLLLQIDLSDTDTNLVSIYNSLSLEYIKINKDSANYYYQKATKLSGKINYDKGNAIAYENKAKLYLHLDSFELAYLYLKKSEKLFIKLNDLFQLANVNFLNGNAHYYANDYDSAIFYYQKSKDYAQNNTNNKQQLADSYKAIGKTHWIKGDMIEALKNYKKSLPIALSINDTSLTCVLYNNIGTIYWSVADYDGALNFYYKSLVLRDSLNDQEGKSLTLNNIGMIFSVWDKDDEAYNYYKHAALICEEIDYPFGTAYSYYNFGNHYLKKQNLDSSIYSFKQAIKNYQLLNDINGVSICYEKLGNIYENKLDYKLALNYFDKMFAIADSVENLRIKANAFYNIAHLNYSKGNLRDALSYSLKSNFISEDKNYKKLCSKNYELLSEIYVKSGNYKKALEYNLIANQFRDSIFNEEKSKQITQMEVLHKTAQKEQENIALKKEQDKQLAQLKAQKSTIRFQYTVVITVVFILLVVVVFMIMFYREKHKLKIANNTKNKLFSIIGHDLRGPLGNFKGLIDLLLMDKEINDPEKINSLLKLMQKTASSNYDLLENLLSWSGTKSGNLVYRPQKLNLDFLINSVFDHNEYNAHIKSIKLKSEVDKNIFVLADDIMLHTILRNLVSNAIKFTKQNGFVVIKSKKISGSFDKNNTNAKNIIEITVSDNGVGIDREILPKIFADDEFYSTNGTESEKGTGLGLKLCKEFVEKNKGGIQVESELNKGSDFIFTIPEYILKN